MITVHHLENSRSQRILWLLEELGLDYDVKRYERDAETRLAPQALLDVHPLGKSPVIEHDGTVVAESGAIVEYLLSTFDHRNLLPPDGTAERRDYTYWLHYAEGTFMPLMVISLIFNRVENGPMPFFVRPVARAIAGKVRGLFLTPNIERNLAFIEATLARQRWFAGERMSGADVLMSMPLEAAAARSGLDAYPAMSAYLQRIHALPAYRRALERGGPYELLR